MGLQYLFCYGSLINRESRIATAIVGKAIPGRVIGYQRGWNVIAPYIGMTGVGIIPTESAVCNGVFVAVGDEELAMFDKREIEGVDYNYIRQEMPRECILEAEEGMESQAKIWLYVVRRPQKPTEEFPILQTYVDVILSGCLEIGEDFAVEFVRTTYGWGHPWCDDRASPKYVRCLDTSKYHRKIDEILAEHVPGGLAARRKGIC